MFNFISNLDQRKRLFFDLMLILSASMLVMLPTFIYGVPGGPDMPQHFQFAQTFYDSITNGTFYPSWAHLPNFGYGDVGIRFYPPLTYYVLSLFRWISGDWFDAVFLSFTCFFFISGIGVYLWAREWFPENASLVAAFAYILIPYHLNEFYQAAFWAEFTASAILPYCFLFTTRICKRGKLIDICGLAVAYGLLILAHLPTAVMASIALLIFSLLSLKKTNFLQTVFKLSVSFLISLILTCFYWVRMVTELDFVKHNTEAFSTEYYSYRSNFTLSYLFPFADITIKPPTTFLNLMVLIILGVMIPILITYFIKRKDKEHASILNVIVITVFTFLMATPLSLKIWELLPLLQKIQFPFRWLSLCSLGCSIILAAGFYMVIGYLQTPKRYLVFLTVGLIIIWIPFDLTYIINHPFYYPKDYFNSIAPGIKAGPSWECWWTVWTKKNSKENVRLGLPIPELLPEKVVINDRAAEVKTWFATERTLNINAGEPGQALFATVYYPHWKATLNGQPVEVTPNENGLISIAVPAEESEVRLYFQEPLRVQIAFYVSGLAWIILFGFFFQTAIKYFQYRSEGVIHETTR